MFNPFIEDAGGDSDDTALVEQARGGSRDALERLVRRHQAWVYNVAVRMVFHPQDAEEVTQEVLVKAVTPLRRNQAAAQPAPAAPTPSEALLTEIRDLLKSKS